MLTDASAINSDTRLTAGDCLALGTICALQQTPHALAQRAQARRSLNVGDALGCIGRVDCKYIDTPLHFTLPRRRATPTAQIPLKHTRTTVLVYAVLKSSTRIFQRSVSVATSNRPVSAGTSHQLGHSGRRGCKGKQTTKHTARPVRRHIKSAIVRRDVPQAPRICFQI